MTKTFTTVNSYRFANPGLPEAMPLGTTVDGSFVWPATSPSVVSSGLKNSGSNDSAVSNFEFGSLGFV